MAFLLVPLPQPFGARGHDLGSPFVAGAELSIMNKGFLPGEILHPRALESLQSPSEVTNTIGSWPLLAGSRPDPLLAQRPPARPIQRSSEVHEAGAQLVAMGARRWQSFMKRSRLTT